MTHEQAAAELSAYLDGELPAAAKASVETHLQACSDCRLHLEELGSTRQLIQVHGRREAPAWFAAKVLAKARESAPERREPVLDPLRYWRPALAFSFVAAGVLFVARDAIQKALPGLPGDEIQGMVSGASGEQDDPWILEEKSVVPAGAPARATARQESDERSAREFGRLRTTASLSRKGAGMMDSTENAARYGAAAGEGAGFAGAAGGSAMGRRMQDEAPPPPPLPPSPIAGKMKAPPGPADRLQSLAAAPQASAPEPLVAAAKSLEQVKRETAPALPSRETYRDKFSWLVHWKSVRPDAEVPQVDFASSIVVALSYPPVGQLWEIVSVQEAPAYIYVYVRSVPAEGARTVDRNRPSEGAPAPIGVLPSDPTYFVLALKSSKPVVLKPAP